MNKIIMYGAYYDAFLWHLEQAKLLVRENKDYGSVNRVSLQPQKVDYIKGNRVKSSVLQMFLLYDYVELQPPRKIYPEFNTPGATALEESKVKVNFGHVNYEPVNDPDYDPLLASKLLCQIADLVVGQLLPNPYVGQLLFDLAYYRPEFQSSRNSRRFLKFIVTEYISNHWGRAQNNIDFLTDPPCVYFNKMAFGGLDREEFAFEWEHFRLPDEYEEFGLCISVIENLTLSIWHLFYTATVEDAVILQNAFRFRTKATRTLDDLVVDKYSRASHSTIRLQLKGLIPELPAFSSFDEVRRVKERKRKQIRRFREVIEFTEEGLRNGDNTILTKIDREIALALKDLNAGQKLAKISEWATYFSVPIASIEMLLGVPGILGIATGVAGTACQISSKQATTKGDWVNLVR